MDKHIIAIGIELLPDISVCNHGLSCGVCCWKYKDRYTRSQTSIDNIVYPTVAIIKSLIQGHELPSSIIRRLWSLSYNHICHHTWCVNPYHVYLGTRSENYRDNYMTPDQIREARKE